MTYRTEVIDEARTYLDVPWRHQGRTRFGIDCAGLIVLIGRKFSLLPSDYDVAGYSRRPNEFDFIKAFRDNMDERPLFEAQPGDAVTFIDGPYPCHVGILTIKYDVLHFVHAYAGCRKTIEQPYTGEWQRKATHCFAYRGIRD